MRIEEIKKKRQHLSEILLDSGEKILLDTDYCCEKALRVGDEITAAAAKKMKDESDYRRAVSRSLWYIESGDLSRKSLAEKLKKAGFSGDACRRAVERMVELGLINDREYALRLAESLLKNCVSRREATFKMINKGLDRDTVREALDRFECDPCAQIKALIIKKYKNKLGSDEDIRKVFAALQRKGFNYSDIKRVLMAFSEELKYSEE